MAGEKGFEGGDDGSSFGLREGQSFSLSSKKSKALDIVNLVLRRKGVFLDCQSSDVCLIKYIKISDIQGL